MGKCPGIWILRNGGIAVVDAGGIDNDIVVNRSMAATSLASNIFDDEGGDRSDGDTWQMFDVIVSGHTEPFDETIPIASWVERRGGCRGADGRHHLEIVFRENGHVGLCLEDPAV